MKTIIATMILSLVGAAVATADVSAACQSALIATIECFETRANPLTCNETGAAAMQACEDRSDPLQAPAADKELRGPAAASRRAAVLHRRTAWRIGLDSTPVVFKFQQAVLLEQARERTRDSLQAVRQYDEVRGDIPPTTLVDRVKAIEADAHSELTARYRDFIAVCAPECSNAINAAALLLLASNAHNALAVILEARAVAHELEREP